MSKAKSILCKVALVSCGYGIFSDSVLVPILSKVYEAFPDAGTGLVNFAVTGVYLFSLVASLLTGFLMRYISKKKLLVIGTILFSLGGIGSFFTNSVGFLIATRALDGLSDGVLAVVSLSLISELYTDEHERAQIIGIYTGVSALFGVLLSFFSGIIAESFDWQYCFLLNVISLTSVLLVIIAVPETPVVRTKDKKYSLASFKDVPILKKFLFEYFALATVYCILFVFVDIYVNEKALGTSILSGNISSIGSLVTFLTGIAFAAVYMRVKDYTPFISHVGLAFSFAGLYLSTSVPASIAMFVFAAFFYSIGYSYYPTKLSSYVPPEQMGTCMAVFNMSYNIACLISSYVPYAIMKITKEETVYSTFLPIAVALAVMSVIIGIRTFGGNITRKQKSK